MSEVNIKTCICFENMTSDYSEFPFEVVAFVRVKCKTIIEYQISLETFQLCESYVIRSGYETQNGITTFLIIKPQ